jgi:photosystem II stability/assembly factor-like uncharacterized protein
MGLLAGVASLLAGAGVHAGVNRWTSVGPEGDSIGSIVADPFAPAVVWAAGSRGLYVSRDGAQRWTSPAALPSYSSAFYDIAVAPPDGRTIYVVGHDGLLKSSDGGATWTELPRKNTDRRVVVDPVDADVVYLVPLFPGREVVKSVDGGTTWSTCFEVTGEGEIQDLFVHPGAARRLLVAVPPGRVYRSDDAGASWTPASASPGDLESVNSFAAFPDEPDRIFAGCATGVLASHDGGVTWVRLPSGPAAEVTRLAAGLVPSPMLYAGTRDSFYRSADRGRTWSPGALPQVAWTGLQAIAVDSGDSAMVYAASEALCVWASSDAGDTWRRSAAGMAYAPVVDVAVERTDPRHVFAAVANGGLYRAVADGTAWEPTNAGLPPRSSPWVVEFDYSEPPVLWAADAYSPGVFRSGDRGTTWTPASTGLVPDSSFGIRALAVDASDALTLYVAGEVYCTGKECIPLYKTTSGGAAWFGAAAGLPELVSVSRLEVHPLSPATVFLTANWLWSEEPAVIFRSNDGGGSWQRLDDLPECALACDPHRPETAYCAGFSDSLRAARVYATGDGGRTWSEQDTTLAGYPRRLVLDPADPAVAWMVASTHTYSVWRSTDGLATWRRVDQGLPGTPIGELAIDATGTRLFAAGGLGGLDESGGVYELEVVSGPATVCLQPARAVLAPATATTLTLTVEPPVLYDTTAVLTSTHPGVASVPGTATIAAGESVATVRLAAGATLGTATITATLPAEIGGASASCDIAVQYGPSTRPPRRRLAATGSN